MIELSSKVFIRDKDENPEVELMLQCLIAQHGRGPFHVGGLESGHGVCRASLMNTEGDDVIRSPLQPAWAVDLLEPAIV